MELTELHQEIAGNAYLLSLEGKGLVIEDQAYPAAHELAEAGWLERYFRGDELCWRWAPRGELALDVCALMSSTDGRQN